MTKPRLCVDIDNVIARTDEVLRGIIREQTRGRVDLRYHQVVEFDYRQCADSRGGRISEHEWNAIHDRFSEPRNVLRVQPVDGVQAHLEGLSDKYAIHLATARLPRTRRATIEWLERHNFPRHDLHFVVPGEKHTSLGSFHAAIEDHYEQAIAFARIGTPCYLIRHPWNQSRQKVENLDWVSGWPDLVQKLG
jgi:uncharacterized HAD superfamily protein